LKHTNHWMRGGTYGWQAVAGGFIGICFTNTMPLMPPWGGKEPRLGNNPLVIAVPRTDGHLVLDMAMSQYSMGKLSQYQSSGAKLPVAGGYDSSGHLSDDPGDIIASRRPLPIGFWKGSGLAFMLDILTTVLSQGNSTQDISRQKVETGVSQTFICLKADESLCSRVTDQIIAYTKSSEPEGPGKSIRYPGEGTLQTRATNLKQGIPVEEAIWSAVLRMG
jgi:3-dehydro-L-gulonate 2-dehydrogenase